MYESFFGLTDRPFAAAPEPRQYFAGASIEAARQTVTRVVERSEGPAMVIGPAGTGKSLLCHLLAAQLSDPYDVVMLASARLCTRRALLQTILFELNLPYRDLEEGELRLSLMDHLEPGRKRSQGMLLLVDEAHALPFKLLEEIRMITNLVREGQSRVRLVLVGNADLEERFTHPKLDSFSQRLAARCYLANLSGEETAGFVRSQLAVAGAERNDIFDAEAVSTVYQLTDGTPRLINQLCDHALMMAALGGVSQLKASGVQEAWADLQQLPSRAADLGQDGNAESTVIEFGQLDDDEAFTDYSTESDAQQPAAADRTAVDPPAIVADDPSPSTNGTAFEEAIDCVPLGIGEAEVEPTFEAAADVFDESFDEEEAVIDRYASLEDEALRKRPRVRSIEGAEIGAVLRLEEENAKASIRLADTPSVDAVAEAEPTLDVEPVKAVGFAPQDDPTPVVIIADFQSIGASHAEIAAIGPDEITADEFEAAAYVAERASIEGTETPVIPAEDTPAEDRLQEEVLQEEVLEEEAPLVETPLEVVQTKEAAAPEVSVEREAVLPPVDDVAEADVEPPMVVVAESEPFEMQVFDPASDPVFPDYQVDVARSEFDVLTARAALLAGSQRKEDTTQIATGGVMADDSDMIVVDEPTATAPPLEEPAEAPEPVEQKVPKRKEFGQLFARLRHG